MHTKLNFSTFIKTSVFKRIQKWTNSNISFLIPPTPSGLSAKNNNVYGDFALQETEITRLIRLKIVYVVEVTFKCLKISDFAIINLRRKSSFFSFWVKSDNNVSLTKSWTGSLSLILIVLLKQVWIFLFIISQEQWNNKLGRL